jgi:glucose/arabinose dehydrogenase
MQARWQVWLAMGAGLLAATCSDSESKAPGGQGGSSQQVPDMSTQAELGSIVDRIHLTQVYTGLSRPTFLTQMPGSDVLLVLEQVGRIRKIENGQVSPEPFLDLTDRIESGGEQGLLGLAFHPRFADNGKFYVNYTMTSGQASGDGSVSEFTRQGSTLTADPSSERRLLQIPDPYSNHNGGMLAFSPSDGYLYIGVGDGGSGGDPQGNGQNMNTLLGKLLRIDVDARDAGEYGIPAGNMTGANVRPEIWSYGLRNPWRFSFDTNGDMYLADVGQNEIEEVDFEPKGMSGRNYGWNTMEGSECFRPGSGCQEQGITPPVVEYTHDSGCSITGGYVYRGSAIPELRGVYLYADYCSGLFGALRMENQQLVGHREITTSLNRGGVLQITSFGVDASGEMYVLSQGGNIYRVDAD